MNEHYFYIPDFVLKFYSRTKSQFSKDIFLFKNDVFQRVKNKDEKFEIKLAKLLVAVAKGNSRS
jgi:hypothetical protein